MSLTIGGHVEVRLSDGRWIEVGPRTIFTYRGGAEQGWRVPRDAEPWDVVYSLFTLPPHWLWLFDTEPAAPDYWVLTIEDAQAYQWIKLCMIRMCRVNATGTPLRARVQYNLLEQVLLSYHDAAAPHEKHYDSRVREALLVLRNSVDTPLTLDELAERCHISRSRLCALFAEQFGDSPMAYLERCRMNHAADLLKMTVQPVKFIAYNCGYPDPTHFGKRFLKWSGLSPKAYRARYSQFG